MTDTHDTNLPEKPVELEEEKKTAEVSEPATTETPAEEIVSEKPVEPVQKLTKEEILAKLKEVVADVENVAKPEIDGLKQSFYKLHNAEQDAARKLFIENGGAAENFVPQTDCVEEEFKNIMSVIKEKRSALTAELEKQKEIKRRGKRLPGRRNPYVQGSAARQVKRSLCIRILLQKRKRYRKRSPERL